MDQFDPDIAIAMIYMFHPNLYICPLKVITYTIFGTRSHIFDKGGKAKYAKCCGIWCSRPRSTFVVLLVVYTQFLFCFLFRSMCDQNIYFIGLFCFVVCVIETKILVSPYFSMTSNISFSSRYLHNIWNSAL